MIRNAQVIGLVLAAVVAACAMPASARAHGSGELGVRGISERKLHTFETRVLGAEHAAEHARSRAAVRRRLARERSEAARIAALPAAERRRLRAARANRTRIERRAERAAVAAVGPESEVGRFLERKMGERAA